MPRPQWGETEVFEGSAIEANAKLTASLGSLPLVLLAGERLTILAI